jgi:hypothetical protein
MSSKRPPWARALYSFVHDGVLQDKYWPEDGPDSDEELLDRIEVAVDTLLCEHFDHEIVDDQCNIPEHRYCVWCNKRETAL